MKRRDKQKNVNRKTREYSFTKTKGTNELFKRQTKQKHTHTYTKKYKEKK